MSEFGIQAEGFDAEKDDVLFQAREALRSLSSPVILPNIQPVSKIPQLKWKSELSVDTSIVAPKVTAPQVVNSPTLYTLLCVLLIIFGVALVRNSNKSFGPEMYAENGLVPAVEAFGDGKNYAVFDLNLNIRRLRDLHLESLTKTPDLVVLGASQWQEANHTLVPGKNYYNAHVHRDYWQDILGVSELLVRNNKLPKTMIISLRDNLFTPISARKDYLWEPGIPYYRDMADRLGLEKDGYWASFPYQRMKQLLSISLLFDNLTRWYNAEEKPHATSEHQFESLDTLLPDGSIVWSKRHMKLFSQERSKKESLAFAEKRLNDPPQVEARGVEAIDKLLTYLKAQGVTVYLAQTPFNPIFYDRVQGSRYADGLAKIDTLVHDLAKQHGLQVIGGYNPHKVGCNATMYIDAEHANASCLKNIFDEFIKLDSAKVAQ